VERCGELREEEMGEPAMIVEDWFTMEKVRALI
jgi:hypothetical protein